ncbi:hypothetical protein JCM11641_001460 [Rhodosporidiobolus odoratus]
MKVRTAGQLSRGHYRPAGALILPFSISLALFFLCTFALLRALSGPRRLSPLRFVSLETEGSRRQRTLLGGERLWVWAGFAFSIILVTQLSFQLRYGQLSSGTIAPVLCSELAFLVLCAVAFTHIITSQHSIPLLHSALSYLPSSSLSQPLLGSRTTAALILAAPLFLVGTLAGPLVPIVRSTSAIRTTIAETMQLFSAASTGDSKKLGPQLYDELQQKLAKAWTDCLNGRKDAIKVVLVVALLVALGVVELRAFLRYRRLIKYAKREEQQARAQPRKPSAPRNQRRRTTAKPTRASASPLSCHQPSRNDQPASHPMQRSSSNASSSSSISSRSSYSCISTAVDPPEPAYQSCALSRASSTRSTTSTRLAYDCSPTSSPQSRSAAYNSLAMKRGESSGSSSSAFSESMPVLAYLVTGGAEDAAHPNEDPVQQSQALAFSKYAAERPQRPKPAMLRRTSSRDEVVGCMLGAREERRSWDTLPPQYASRAGSRRVQQNMEEQEKDENEEEADYAEGVGRSVTSNSAHLIDSGDEESLFENLETGDLGRYAGPPSYMLVAMRDCRSKDAAASAVSLCLAGVLYGVKATWAEQIMNRAGLAFFILIIENIFPAISLLAVLTVTYMRQLAFHPQALKVDTMADDQDERQMGWWIPTAHRLRRDGRGSHC